MGRVQSRSRAAVKDTLPGRPSPHIPPHPEDLSGIAVIHLDVELLQEVLQLLEVHLVVLVFVSFSQAGMNPAGQEVRKEPRSPGTPEVPATAMIQAQGHLPGPGGLRSPVDTAPRRPDFWHILISEGRPGGLFGGNVTSNEGVFFLFSGFEPFQNFKNISFLTLKGFITDNLENAEK